MSSKEKMLQYFKNQVKGNVLQSFQQFKSDSPEIPTRMVPDANVLQPFALHINIYIFWGGGRKKFPHPHYLLMHVEEREVQRDGETVKAHHTQNLWKAKTSPSPNTPKPL